MTSARTAAFAGLVLLCVAGVAQGEGRVHASPEEVRPLPVGASVPSVRVQPVAGEPVDLAELVRDSGALLVFYRGGW